MKSWINRKCFIVAVVVLLIGFLIIVPWMGNFLVADDHEERGTVVVLMGSIPDRVLETADVYDEGYAEMVVFVHSYMNGYDKLVEREVTILGHADISKMAVMELGIPEDVVVLLDGNARSTRDEAISVKEYLRKNKEISRVLLVTSS